MSRLFASLTAVARSLPHRLHCLSGSLCSLRYWLHGLPDRLRRLPGYLRTLPHQLRRLAAARKVNPLLWALLVQGALILATLGILVFRAPPQEVLFLPIDAQGVQPQALPRQSLLAQMAREGAGMPEAESTAIPLPLPDLLRAEHSAQIDALAGAFSPLGSLQTEAYRMSATGSLLATASAQGIGEAPGDLAQVSFFGIGERAHRYVVLLDTSNSMFVRSRGGMRYRYDFGQVKEETCRLLESFNANTLFNLIVYEGGAWAWEEQMLAASLPVRRSAQEWVRALGENPSLSITDRRGRGPLLREGGGTRLDTALKLAFEHYDPEVVFIVTDGEINRIPGGRITEEAIVGLIRSLRAEQVQPARIHVIHFQTAQMREVELQTLHAIAREGNGRFTRIIATEK